MGMAGRLCSVQALVTFVVFEIALMLGFWVGDYLPAFFTQPSTVCDVTNSSIVRKLIHKNWSPVLNRHGVTLPLTCPFNLSRDIHGIRESVKGRRSSHWQCLKCGKKFYFERHLDLHIERRHSELINKAEDSVCLSNYCDIMRCDVLMSTSFLDDESKSTDVSVWSPGKGPVTIVKEKTSPATSSTNNPNVKKPPVPLPHSSHSHAHERDKLDGQGGGEDEEVHCDENHFTQLRIKCYDLVWHCLQGLIEDLDPKEFKVIQSELEAVSCSYLSCSKYGDKCCPPSSKKGKLRPFFIVFGSIFISLCLALAYYFTWIYTQSSNQEPMDDAMDEYDNVQSQSSSQGSHGANAVRKISPPLVNRTTHL